MLNDRANVILNSLEQQLISADEVRASAESELEVAPDAASARRRRRSGWVGRLAEGRAAAHRAHPTPQNGYPTLRCTTHSSSPTS